MKKIVALLVFAATILHTHASTNEVMKAAEAAPLVIDSRDGLKCDREKQVCTAAGEVIIRKGPYEIHSNTASAFMRKNAVGKMEIGRVEAHDNVRFFGLDGEKATSEHATYDVDKHLIDLKPGKGRQVIVWKDEYVMLSNFLDIHLQEDAEQKLKIEKIDAKGHVTLSSPDELIEGDLATMTPETKLIIITGDVKVNKKEGQLRGSYAQVNLDTKASKVLKRDGVNTDEKVRVFVYPEKTDKK